MQAEITVTNRIVALAARSVRLVIAAALAAPLAAQSSDSHIRVDQFGYRPLAQKTAVLREPLVGYDAPDPYTPGPLIEVRRAADQSVAFSGAAVTWNRGATHDQSGDRIWWFDFSALEEEGTFFIHDPAAAVSSENFEIRDDVYREALTQALRMYYYQRCGTEKAVPHAHANWSDTACHLATEQDRDCRYVLNPDPSTSRDLSGGWHDAGDYNKYVNYADGALHDLLAAYEASPHHWGENLAIPESGNGIPDILDEIKWELDWLLKMQIADGSVLHKVSVTDFSAASPPSGDSGPRRYAPPTASATISACGVLAHAALVFETVPDPAMAAYAAQLAAAARSAWDWLEANPSQIPSYYDNAGFMNASAEDAPYAQEMNRLCAAAYLLALDGDAKYRTFFDAGYENAHLFQWNWASPWEKETQDGLLFYARTPGATRTVADRIEDAYAVIIEGADHLGTVRSGMDAYRALLFDGDYTWGSNGSKSKQGQIYMAMIRAGLDVGNAGEYSAAAEDFVHYLHGVNPTGFAYLTNMEDWGAGTSVNEMYHRWFCDGSVWDSAATSLYGPAPGYITGGPNPSFSPDPSYSGGPIEPPMNQPVQKSYLDWNTAWPENSWEVTECHIPYQAAYVRLLAEFAVGPPAVLGLEMEPLVSGSSATITVGNAGPGGTVVVVWSLKTGSFLHSGSGWCVDLGLDLPGNPAGHIVCMGTANISGLFNATVNIPAGTAGLTIFFQAARAGTWPYPVQSAVMKRVVD